VQLPGERARLARELHDAMSQSLFSLELSAETAGGLLRTDVDRAEAALETVRQLARQIVAELRSVVEGLRPADLERDGLVAVLRSQFAVAGRVHGVAVEVDVSDDDDDEGDGGVPSLDPDAEHQVLRILQEAVTNALRHAQASRVVVTLAVSDGVLVARVADDGVGFDPSARVLRARRLGLTSMQDRADALGGTLAIDSAPGRGTAVELRVPT
jgi:signal transduction histidine kinase